MQNQSTDETESVDSGKSIRYNVPQAGNPFNESPSYTLHAGGVTVYFDEIEEDRVGSVFVKDGTQTAFVADDECQVSPTTAMKHAELNPGQKVPFADD